MIEAISTVIGIMIWIGFASVLCAAVNIGGKIIINIKNGEKFTWGKFFKGIGKVCLLWVASLIVALVCAMLPFINTALVEAYGLMFIGDEILSTISSMAVIGICVNALIVEIKKAIETIKKLMQ